MGIHQHCETQEGPYFEAIEEAKRIKPSEAPSLRIKRLYSIVADENMDVDQKCRIVMKRIGYVMLVTRVLLDYEWNFEMGRF